jgi:Predicted phosphoesterases, related to the Icc protein
MVNIIALTDIHGNVKNLNNILKSESFSTCDLILIAGDLTNFGDEKEISSVISLLEETKKPYYYVPGNCDYVNKFNENQLRRNLHSNYVLFLGYAIIGIGGSLKTPFNTPFEITEEDVERIIKEVYKRISKESYKGLLIVSHNPPYNTKLDLTKSGIHVGSKILRKYIEEVKPILVISGHVHEARSVDQINETIIVNPGPLKDGFFAEIKLEEKPTVVLKSI